jgi:rhodanese-related sulfurtransferase
MKKVFLILMSCIVVFTSTMAFAWIQIDVTPNEAYDLVKNYSNVYILDVRTPEEWIWVGHPGMNKQGIGVELSGKVVNIAWEKYVKKVLAENPSFITEVNEVFGDNPNVVILTLCRSGKRSVDAANALDAAGYTVNNGYTIYNIKTGFEGAADPTTGYRTVNGWKINGLPYTFGYVGAYAD